jgi:hypothetical protein
MDILIVILIAAQFGLSFAYVSGCNRLKGARP